MTNNEMILMEDELGYLTTYVELQNMRLNNVLNFEIDVATSVDIKKCFLPTMLLQPLVENAILHGVSTIKTNPTITLRVEKEDDFLVLKVEDNGIGRKESARLKKIKKGPAHKSFANQIM